MKLFGKKKKEGLPHSECFKSTQKSNILYYETIQVISELCGI